MIILKVAAWVVVVAILAALATGAIPVLVLVTILWAVFWLWMGAGK